MFLSQFELEIHWRGQFEIIHQDEEDDEDTIEVEVVYIIGQSDDQPGTRFYNKRQCIFLLIAP